MVLEMPAISSFVMVGFVDCVSCDKLNNVPLMAIPLKLRGIEANLIETTRIALRHSLTGFEFACSIPGSVGAVFMNAVPME